MKKTILLLLVLTFVPTTDGSESKQQGAKLIKPLLEKSIRSKKNKLEVNSTKSKNESDGEQATNNKSDRDLDEALDDALAEALKKSKEKAKEKALIIASGKTQDIISGKKSDKKSDKIPDKTKQNTPEKESKKNSEKDTDKTFDEEIDKALQKALIKTLDKALEKSLDKITDKPSEKFPLSVWVGYGYYAMNEFNRKLSVEGNKTIDGGLNVGIEFAPKGFKVGGLELSPFPIGVEYLEADSETTHTNGGTCIFVDWEIPVVGIYFWPEVRSHKLPEEWMDDKGWDLRLRPLGVGYYVLGKVIDAELDISDSPGYLKVKDETIGIMSQIGIEYVDSKETFKVYIDSGYRLLKFSSVMRETKGGFAGGSPSAMPEDLDYSGFIIKAGLCVKF